MSPLSIAYNRFGLGARGDQTPPADPKRWLTAQFAAYQPRPAQLATVAQTPAIMKDLTEYLVELRTARRARRDMPAPQGAAAGAAAKPKQSEDFMALKREAGLMRRDHYRDAIDARFDAALVTPAPFVERLVYFWSNHFAVSANQAQVLALAGAYEFDAIRPHVLGKFRDMLSAVARHPAMMIYLDQTDSIGPNSRFGARAAGNANMPGLNENLAREMIELHTLGANTGYTQSDVTEFARALTGWTAAGYGRGEASRAGSGNGFLFVEGQHEPGARTILSRSYPQTGEDQAQAVLDMLARHPATATHIATKLARHFAGDTPPPAMVQRLARAFTQSDGDLPTVYRAIIDSPEAWVETPVKFRTPSEWAVASMRALNMRPDASNNMVGLMNQLGQGTWRPGQPNGYDDIAASWAGPDAVMRRVEQAERFASRAAEIDVRALAPKLYPGGVSATTAQTLERAESPGQALALLLVAPEAMRR